MKDRSRNTTKGRSRALRALSLTLLACLLCTLLPATVALAASADYIKVKTSGGHLRNESTGLIQTVAGDTIYRCAGEDGSKGEYIIILADNSRWRLDVGEATALINSPIIPTGVTYLKTTVAVNVVDPTDENKTLGTPNAGTIFAVAGIAKKGTLDYYYTVTDKSGATGWIPYTAALCLNLYENSFAASQVGSFVGSVSPVTPVTPGATTSGSITPSVT